MAVSVIEKDLRSALDRLADVADSISYTGKSLFQAAPHSPIESRRQIFNLGTSSGSDEVEETDNEPLADLLRNLNDTRFLHGRLFPEPLGPLLINLDDNRYFRKRPISPIELLPDEIYLKIFQHLDVVSLVRCLLVSNKLNQVGNDNILWRILYDRDMTSWSTFYSPKPEAESMFSASYFNSIVKNVNSKLDDFLRDGNRNLEEVEANAVVVIPEWKMKYKSLYNRNSPQFKLRVDTLIQKMKVQIASRTRDVRTVDLLRRIPLLGNKPITLAMYGKGRISSAKRLLYQMMSNESPFKVNKLYAGHDGVGSGVGFKLNGLDFNVSVITKDVNVMAMNRQGFESFFKSCEALCYVIDTADDLEKSKLELESLLSNFGIAAEMPLVVFYCGFGPHDLTFDDTNAHLVPCDVASILSLETVKSRQWCVQEVRNESVDSIYCAFDWIANSI